MPASIYYRELKAYKYQLMDRYVHETGITSPTAVKSGGQWITMTKTGRLTIKKGYAWDGPSGPTIDSKNFMRGSLVHDAIYQLIRERLLVGRLRKKADQILYDICREDGMSKLRAEYVYNAVRVFGGSAVKPRAGGKTIKAP